MRNVLSVPQVQPKARPSMSTRFDLTDLRLFVHVAEAGSITHGAVRANMTLASASERIRAMEDALSAPLLERKRRGIALTSAGRVLLHHAWTVTQQLEQMRGDLTNFGKGLRGHVRLLSNIGAMEFLPAPLAAFLSAHPNIDVDLEHRGSGEIVRSIAAGRGDIGIVGETVDLAAELEHFPFEVVRLVLVTPLRHPLGRNRKIAFREALDREFVGFAAGSPMQDLLNYHAFRAGRRLKLRISLNGSDLMCQMVEKGIGLAILPETAARRCQQSMAIRVIPLTDTWALRQLTICVRSFRSLPVHAQRLVEFLRSRASWNK
jgi:molybdate transport repressor ModE-like protein